MIDLHCHSNYSDGIDSPRELVNKALKNGVKYIALTDHDTTAGLESFKTAAKDTLSDIHIINGIELSVNWKKHVIHILGLNLLAYNNLDELITRQNTLRIERAQKISALLALHGLDNAYEKACELAGHARIGRPHLAKILLKEGMVSDMQSAFKKYLGRGRSAYVPTNWITLEEAIKAITNAKGDAVLAHPLKYGLTRTKLHELILAFRLAGGAGIEVVSGAMNQRQIQEIAGLCLRFKLLSSTGSDYHGEEISRITLGRQQQIPINCPPIWNKWDIFLQGST